MLVYNVNEMSSTTTPSRPTRGVPGIDTRGPADQLQSSAAFNAWPLTPPQSANDSRRPSLAFSSLSDASHSGPSSISGYSQPATPIHSLQNSHDFTPQWPVDVQRPVLLDCTTGHMSQPVFPSAAPTQLCTVKNEVPPFSPAGKGNGLHGYGVTAKMGSPMRGTWLQHTQQANGMGMHADLGTPLYQTSQALGLPALMPTPLEGSVFPNYDTTSTEAFYQPSHPQVVVPSQVGPQEDYSMGQYPDYEDQHHAGEALASSFDSSTSGFSEWDHVEPSSPHNACFTPSEDDFVMVNNNNNTTMNYQASLAPTRASLSHRSRRGIPITSRDSRPRRRPSKRSRKGLEGNAWFEQEVAGTTLRFEGARFEIVRDPEGMESESFRVVATEAKESKPHKCSERKEDGTMCGAGFERSEHLRRHMSSHSNIRRFHCPLPKCGKYFTRPDNTGDHFKTHLRQTVTGSRNKHHNWATLEPLIMKGYDEKTAVKITTNLRKWLHATYAKDEFSNMTLCQWHTMTARDAGLALTT